MFVITAAEDLRETDFVCQVNKDGTKIELSYEYDGEAKTLSMGSEYENIVISDLSEIHYGQSSEKTNPCK
jgi:hypothetical protein